MRLPLVPRRGADEPDWQAGILVIGSPLSGKTWLVHRFATGAFPECLDKARRFWFQEKVEGACFLYSRHGASLPGACW